MHFYNSIRQLQYGVFYYIDTSSHVSLHISIFILDVFQHYYIKYINGFLNYTHSVYICRYIYIYIFMNSPIWEYIVYHDWLYRLIFLSYWITTITFMSQRHLSFLNTRIFFLYVSFQTSSWSFLYLWIDINDIYLRH